MSSLRVNGTNRASSELGQIGDTMRVDTIPGTASFPEALGAATDSKDARQANTGSSQQNQSRRTPRGDESLAGGESVAAAVSDPANSPPAGPENPIAAHREPDAQSPGPTLSEAGLTLSANPATVGSSTDAQLTAASLRRSPGAGGLVAPLEQPPNGQPQRHSTRHSFQEIGALATAFGIADPVPVNSPPTRQYTENIAGSSAGEDSTGPVILTPLADQAHSADPPGGWARPAIAGHISTQWSADIAPALTSNIPLNDPAAAVAAHFSPALLAGEPAAQAAAPVSFVLSLQRSASPGIEPDPDASARTVAAAPGSGEDIRAAPIGGAASRVEGVRSTTLDSVRGDAPGILVGSGSFAGLPVDGSPNSTGSIPSPTGLADQLSYHLIRSIDNAGQEVVLRLHPPELGDLTVRVLVNGREVSAWFLSPQTQVQQAISQALGQLQTDLGNAGYNLNSTWIGADARSPREGGGRSGPPQHRGGAIGPRIEEPHGSPALSATSGVSIYV